MQVWSVTMLEHWDREKILESRLKDIAEARQARKRDIWPGPCPSCFAGVGEPCITYTGGRAVRHKDRLPSNVSTQKGK